MLHSAFSFAPESFHDEIAKRVAAEGLSLLDYLHRRAITTVREASSQTQVVLGRLRLDGHELLQVSTEPTPPISYCYMMCLAPYLVPSPSLSSRCRWAYVVLQRVLPILGWQQLDVNHLIYGQPLHQIVECTNESALFSRVTALDQFGGWLPIAGIDEARTSLKSIENQVLAPTSEMMRVLDDVAAWTGTPPHALIQNSYVDALAMLNPALHDQNALMMILD